MLFGCHFHSHSVVFVVRSLSCNTNIRSLGFQYIREWVISWELTLWSLGCIFIYMALCHVVGCHFIPIPLSLWLGLSLVIRTSVPWGYGILENEWYYEGDITEFKVYIYTWPCVMLMDVMSFHSHSVEFVVGSLSCNTSIRFVGCRDIKEWEILWSLGCIYTLGLVSCCWMSFDSHSVGFVAGCMSCNTNIRPLRLWDTREWVILWGWYYGV